MTSIGSALKTPFGTLTIDFDGLVQCRRDTGLGDVLLTIQFDDLHQFDYQYSVTVVINLYSIIYFNFIKKMHLLNDTYFLYMTSDF